RRGRVGDERPHPARERPVLPAPRLAAPGRSGDLRGTGPPADGDRASGPGRGERDPDPAGGRDQRARPVTELVVRAITVASALPSGMESIPVSSISPTTAASSPRA